MPQGFEKHKIEQLFIETGEKGKAEFELLLLSENTDKIRKRVLLSQQFGTALKVKHVLKIFSELRRCKETAPHLFIRSQLALQTSTQRDSFQQTTPLLPF